MEEFSCFHSEIFIGEANKREIYSPSKDEMRVFVCVCEARVPIYCNEQEKFCGIETKRDEHDMFLNLLRNSQIDCDVGSYG